jgi:hypothetical protein
MAGQRDRARRPRTIELERERPFVFEPLQDV